MPKRAREEAAPKEGGIGGATLNAPLQGCNSATRGSLLLRHFKWTESVVRLFFKEDVHCADARCMRTYLLNLNYPPSVQIRMHLASLTDLHLLPFTFYKSLPPKESFYTWIVEAVGRFVFEGKMVMDDLKKHLDRWDSNFKEGAVAANRFAELANLLSLKEVSSWAVELEEACLHPASPVAIYGKYEKIYSFYGRARPQLWLLFLSARSAVRQASAPVTQP